jgi:hypothetical protein
MKLIEERKKYKLYEGEFFNIPCYIMERYCKYTKQKTGTYYLFNGGLFGSGYHKFKIDSKDKWYGFHYIKKDISPIEVEIAIKKYMEVFNKTFHDILSLPEL